MPTPTADSQLSPPPALDRADRLIATALFAGLSFVYFITLAGITSSNDGSHYALLRTMVDNRAFALRQFDDFAEGNDVAIAPEGRLFSDRPPGTAIPPRHAALETQVLSLSGYSTTQLTRP